MIRKILFRGKSGKFWHEGDLLQNGGDYFINAHCEIMGIHRVKVADKSVGQFTGLTDFEGVRIFEGDTLSASFDGKQTLFNCFWSEERAAFMLRNEFNPAWGLLSRLFEIATEDKWIIENLGNISGNAEDSQ